MVLVRAETLVPYGCTYDRSAAATVLALLTAYRGHTVDSKVLSLHAMNLVAQPVGSNTTLVKQCLLSLKWRTVK